MFRNVNFGRRLLCAAILFASLTAVMPALASAATQAFGGRTLQKGMKGTDVETLQRDLTSLGWYTRPTGDFTYWTIVHVKDFQKKEQVSADGVVGPQTYAKLKTAMAAVENAADTPDTTEAPAGTASATSATLPSGDSGGAGFVPVNTSASAPVQDATLNSDGVAVAPSGAPTVVQEVIQAANQIAFDPYVYGGGHNGWGAQSGYDCSGSTSYALHAAGLLNGEPLDSTEFESYGDAGVGKWITIYATDGHAYMNVAGLWFDTADQSSSNGNDRWSTTRVSPSAGFVARHPDGW